MKILTSKIVNGKKMFLIEDNDSQGRVFAQDDKPIKKENISYYNPYYVDIKGINSSDNVSTKSTPSKKITPQELKQIKESPTNVGNIALKEKQEKAQRLKEAEEAYQKRKSGAPVTPELLAQETQAIGDKISLQNIPGIGQYVPDILDVTGAIGSMASGLGAIPLNLNRGNYAQALLSVASPLAMGALAGVGSPTVGQFVNNVANPFAGIKLKANLPEGTVQRGFFSDIFKKQAPEFKSEINWGNWNKEIPKNKALMKEYNAIEQTSKANGTWMKNPDGSVFQGTPEQFIQQNSKNFKKAFPEGFNTTYRGTTSHFVEDFNPNRSMATFTGTKDLASSYSGKGWQTDVSYLTADSPQFSRGLYQLAYPKSSNSLTFDGMNTDWTSISLLPPEVRKQNILNNIDRLSSQIEKQKSFLASGIQDPIDKSWKFPNSDVIYSNSLYDQGTTHMDNILNEYKNSLKFADNLADNPNLLETMRKDLGDEVLTDDIAKYVKDNGIDYVKINNIDDGGFGDVTMVNHKKGNYLKSLIGNNGMFDMTNPNIYKTIIGGVATGTLGKQAVEKQEFGGKIKVLDTKIENGKKYFLINK